MGLCSINEQIAHNINFAHSITYVLQVIMDFGDNTNAGQIGKLIMSLSLSRFNTSMKRWGWIFLMFVSSAVSSINYIGLVITMGYYFHVSLSNT